MTIEQRLRGNPQPIGVQCPFETEHQLNRVDIQGVLVEQGVEQ